MLASAKTIEVVAETLEECKVKTIVLDPVCLKFVHITACVLYKADLMKDVGYGVYQWRTASSWRCRPSTVQEIATYDHLVDAKCP